MLMFFLSPVLVPKMSEVNNRNLSLMTEILHQQVVHPIICSVSCAGSGVGSILAIVLYHYVY